MKHIHMGFLICCFSMACSKPEQKINLPIESNTQAPSSPSHWIELHESDAFFEAPAWVLPAPENDAALTVQSKARVIRIFIKPGDRIKKFQPLIEFAYPDLAVAASQYLTSSAQVKALQHRLNQLKTLASEGMSRTSDQFDIEMKWIEAQGIATQTKSLILAAGFSIDSATTLANNGGKASLNSPISGTVTDVNAILGQIYDSNSNPIVRITQGLPGRIEARFAHKLPEQLSYEWHLGGSSDTWIPLQFISQSDDRAQAAGGTRAWFEPTTKIALQPGIQGQIRIRSHSKNAFRIPTQAIVEENGQSAVIVMRNKPTQVFIQRIVTLGSESLIEGELQAGDSIAEYPNKVSP